jgi:hypothetical protein
LESESGISPGAGTTAQVGETAASQNPASNAADVSAQVENGAPAGASIDPTGSNGAAPGAPESGLTPGAGTQQAPAAKGENGTSLPGNGTPENANGEQSPSSSGLSSGAAPEPAASDAGTEPNAVPEPAGAASVPADGAPDAGNTEKDSRGRWGPFTRRGT